MTDATDDLDYLESGLQDKLKRVDRKLGQGQVVELYNIPRGSKIYGFKNKAGKDVVVIFDHLDGMYSYCYNQADQSQLLHLSGSTPLENYRDGYRIHQEPKKIDVSEG